MYCKENNNLFLPKYIKRKKNVRYFLHNLVQQCRNYTVSPAIFRKMYMQNIVVWGCSNMYYEIDNDSNIL